MFRLSLTPGQRQAVRVAVEELLAGCSHEDYRTAAEEALEIIRQAPNIDDGCDQPAPKQFVPGAGYGTNPHPNDDIGRQLSTNPLALKPLVKTPTPDADNAGLTVTPENMKPPTAGR
jgi:hypothetical protein